MTAGREARYGKVEEALWSSLGAAPRERVYGRQLDDEVSRVIDLASRGL